MEKDLIDANRLAWDLRTGVHLNSDFYDVPGFLAGKLTLHKPELELLPDVVGKNLLHLQCHFGLDTLSWRRLGAQVTGIDLSPAAIQAARDISVRSKLEGTFVEADVQSIEGKFCNQFDLGISSYGVLCWLGKLNGWAKGISDSLKPGGKFVLVEFHPFLDLAFNGKVSGHDRYFEQESPKGEMTSGTYTDPKAPIEYMEYRWQHPISNVISAFLDAGMTLCSFREYPYSPYKLFPSLDTVSDGCWTSSKDCGRMPYLYSIVVQKPALLQP